MRPYKVECKVQGCTDLVWIKKEQLCSKHYSRFKDNQQVEILSSTKICKWCAKEFTTFGAASKIQIYCTTKCRGADKRKREQEKEGFKEKDVTYKYKWKLKQYGLTEESYREIFNKQSGCCAICHRDEIELGMSLSVDHDHSNGDVRGLLCRRCNTSIGSFEEDILLLEAAISYLRSYGK